jgi:hypothetical protein
VSAGLCSVVATVDETNHSGSAFVWRTHDR